MNKLFLYLVKLYQKYLSPHKGYCCAYGVLYKQGSCSERVSIIIREHGLIGGRAKIKHQFRLCAEAYKKIRRGKKTGKKSKKKEQERSWCETNPCEVLNCMPLPRSLCRGGDVDGDLPCDCSL